MLVSSPQGRPAVPAGAEEESGLRADLASRVLSGPELWTDWLEDLDRPGLLEQLLAGGVIDEAAASSTRRRPPRRTATSWTGAEREEHPAVRAGRVPVPRRGL